MWLKIKWLSNFSTFAATNRDEEGGVKTNNFLRRHLKNYSQRDFMRGIDASRFYHSTTTLIESVKNRYGLDCWGACRCVSAWLLFAPATRESAINPRQMPSVNRRKHIEDLQLWISEECWKSKPWPFRKIFNYQIYGLTMITAVSSNDLHRRKLHCFYPLCIFLMCEHEQQNWVHKID